MNIRDEARRMAEEAWNKADFLSKQRFEAHIESALLAFAKLVLERTQKASGFDEETCKLAEQGWEQGFCAGQRVTNSHIADALRKLEEGSNIGSHQPKEQP